MVTMLLGRFTWLWYLTLVYIPIYTICALHGGIFQSRERDQDCFVAALCNISFRHDNKRTMKVIWDVCSVLLSCPHLGHYLRESINNSTQPVGRRGWITSPAFHSLIVLQAC